jgi:succinoglycan biosynthesis protein ExoM
MHICVCICTYQRPRLLKKLLVELGKQDTEGEFTFSVVVADNDREQSAQAIVHEVAPGLPVPITYCVEPQQNIPLVRNKALSLAAGDFVAFIDDDEFPAAGWLVALFNLCVEKGVAGVLGPVKPHFEQAPPDWLMKGGFYERPSHLTGFVMNWRECRTGNVLFARRLLAGMAEPFCPEFGIGSEDVDFFRRMSALGHTFLWCAEAVVYETVLPNRWKRSFLLKRGLLRGKMAVKHPEDRWLGLGKSVIAVPLYTLALPFLLLAGQHHFMKYLVKLCDHAGRLLASVGLSPVRQREN